MTTFDPLMRSGWPQGAQIRDTARIIYDLRGALQAVLSGVALLDAAELAPKSRDQLDRAAAAARSLEGLLEGLLGDDPGPEPRRPAPAAPGPRPDLSGLRILLAEDNPTNQLVAMQMLRALNAEVTLSCDGVEAHETFERADFDLVVVDIEMPRLTGLDVIRRIRARSDGRADVPIIALTAYVMREHRDQIAAAGANGLISKPITSVDALCEALRAHVAPVRRPVPAAPVASKVAEAGSEAPVVDSAVFDALCAAIGAGMMTELLEKVVADLRQARADLAGALAPLDCKPIRSASHILISVAGAIGATRLQSCARALNIAAHAEDGAVVADGVRRCLDEIDAAVAFAHDRRSGG